MCQCGSGIECILTQGRSASMSSDRTCFFPNAVLKTVGFFVCYESEDCLLLSITASFARQVHSFVTSRLYVLICLCVMLMIKSSSKYC